MEKKGISEDHDSRTLPTSHLLRYFRERMDVNAIVIESGSEHARDDFEQESSCHDDSEDFPLGSSKTGSR